MSELRKRLEEKRKKLNERGKTGKVIFLKDDQTLRVRPLPVGEDKEFVFEVIQFYLGSDIKGVYSNATFGKPCPIMEKYEELKNSKDSDDKNLAKLLVPKRKFMMPVLVYKDLKGKEIDTENSGKFIQITGDIYKVIIDNWLDTDDWGDPTDPTEGYDMKIGRMGSGKLDTTYSCSPCPKSPTPKEWRKIVDIDEMVAEIIEDYDACLEKLNTFLGEPDMLHDDPPKKLSSKSDRESRESRRSRRESTDE